MLAYPSWSANPVILELELLMFAQTDRPITGGLEVQVQVLL